MAKKFETRIEALEQACTQGLPGTQLERSPLDTTDEAGLQRYGWTLSLGTTGMKKHVFKGNTVEGVLSLAEDVLLPPKAKSKHRAKV